MTDDIKKALLRKLVAKGIIGGKHTAYDNLPKGFPSDLRGKVKDLVKELKKEKILLSKPTSYGKEISINVKIKKSYVLYWNIFK